MVGNSFRRRGLTVIQRQGAHGFEEWLLQQASADKRHAEDEKEQAHGNDSVKSDGSDVGENILNHGRLTSIRWLASLEPSWLGRAESSASAVQEERVAPP